MQIVTRPLESWRPGEALPTDEVHVWVAVLAEGEPEERYRLCLTGDEEARAKKFRRDSVRNQFVATRGILREILAGYLACEPACVPIVYEAAGKPVLADSAFHFNLTHSENLAAFAVARTGRIGIDIERNRSMANCESLIERFFSKNECESFRDLPAEVREETFFRMWTRKEALLKALGQGIHALELCDISIGDAPRVLSLFGDSKAGDCWRICDWLPAEGYAGALAIENV